MRSSAEIPERGTSAGRLAVISVSLGIAVLSTSFVIDAFGGGRTTERSGAVASDGPVDNGLIYFRAENDQGQAMGGIVEPDGSGQRDAFPGDPAAEHQQLSFSPDGTRVAYVDGREGHRGIYVANADGSNAVRATDLVNDSWPNWSPDGTIAFVGTRFDPTIGFCHPGGGLLGCPTDIYTMGADGSNVTDITDDPGFEFDPTWSRDGTKIAYASTSDVAAPTTITVMNADGTGRVKMSPSNGGSDFHPSWSPDGTQIVFGGIHYEDWGLFEVRADGADQRTLLFGVGTYAVAPAWSPDGSLIALGGNVGDYGRPEGVFVMRPDGSGITKLAEVPHGWAIREIAWRPVAVAPATARVTGVFDLGLRGSVSGLTYGFGSLWVDGYEDPTGPGHVIRLDPKTGTEQADISIGSVAPGWEVGGGGIVVGDGSVWIVGTAQVPGASPGVFAGVDTVLVRIDPSTNRVVDRIVLGGKVAADVAIDANGVWVLFGGDDDKMEVARVDPATDQVVATIPLQQAYGHYLFSVDGAILAFTNETTADTIGNSVVNVIDPPTDTVTASVSLGDYMWPAAGDGSVWASTGTTLERIDTSSGTVIGTWPLGSTGDSLSVGAGGVWSVGPMGRSTVSRWNPALQAVDLSVAVPDGAGANVIATSTDAVWVLSFDGAITRIQLSN